MKTIRIYLKFLVLVLPLLSFSQKVENIHFEQVGKQIHIYYDLEGSDAYTLQVFCSTDNGNHWGEPLKYVSGAVDENQKQGKGKMIVWDVLTEKEKLSGEIQFKIEAFPSNKGYFTDTRDGQTYKWVKIGEQVWMAENINYKTGNSWCYDNKVTNCNKYGRLYNWKTAHTVCPSGWHLPTDNECKVLEIFLGMSKSEADYDEWRAGAGKKMKSKSGWDSEVGGTDAVGFSSLPGGYRSPEGVFEGLGIFASWWSPTNYDLSYAWYRLLYYDFDQVFRNIYSEDSGFSVRCIRD